jgi:cell division protein FtsB
MRAWKYIFGLWTAVAVYGVTSVLYGASGLFVYRELLAERDRQRGNMEKLGLINESLENTKNSLLYDRDTITVYARDLGYGQNGEQYVRIVGLGDINKVRTHAGDVIRARRPEYIPDRLLKIAALCCGIAVSVILLLFDLLGRRRINH